MSAASTVEFVGIATGLMITCPMITPSSNRPKSLSAGVLNRHATHFLSACTKVVEQFA